MDRSREHDTLGALIWESPLAPPAPKFVSYVLSGTFLLLAGALSLGVVPTLVNARDALDRIAGIAGSILVLALAGAGIWIFRRARAPRHLSGVQFFALGLEFGPLRGRRSVAYRDLQSMTFEPMDVPTDQRDPATDARQTLSPVATYPARIGDALDKLNANRVESFAVIQLVGEDAFRVAMSHGISEQIEAAVRANRSRFANAG